MSESVDMPAVSRNADLTENWIAGAAGVPLNVSGCTATWSCRVTQDPDAVTLLTKALSIPVGTDGNLVLSLVATETLSIPAGRFFYDIFIVFPNSTKQKLCQGVVVVQ